ncbi:hypothetical protein POTOM_032348 [Populus tomentosa]|uniref:Uncharacterized protein n=1 Tax=Populus tomentosa TaxID=118781 RepID=A0A8X7ZK82_POPTO|nr:hypothetical protein POTOM_032348 [Populus tomentosa]
MGSTPVSNERLDFGKMGYGCQHYRRRCQIRAPCCNEIFTCRHCHNEATNMLKNFCDRHELNRYDVKQVICAVCDTEQPVAQACTNCGVNMGEYFCEICKFFDDDVILPSEIDFSVLVYWILILYCQNIRFFNERPQKDSSIVMIVGSVELVVAKIIFTARSVVCIHYPLALLFSTVGISSPQHAIGYHCAGSCYATSLLDNHLCVENSMRHHCPICYEYLFDSLKETTVMKCGHTMHGECYDEMIKRDKYCCPICSKSIIDMSKTWKRIDEEIEATVMPEDYRHRKVRVGNGIFIFTHQYCGNKLTGVGMCVNLQVWILCNDCNDTTEVYFHIIGQKCSHCKSYNTRTIAPPVLPQ